MDIQLIHLTELVDKSCIDSGPLWQAVWLLKKLVLSESFEATQATHYQPCISPIIVLHYLFGHIPDSLSRLAWGGFYSLEPLEPFCIITTIVHHHPHPEGLHLGWSGVFYNESDSDIWADRCGGALQGGVDCEGPHPASNTEIQKTPGTGTVHKFEMHLLALTIGLLGE